MGFRPKLDTVLIQFVNPDHPLHGLEMRCRASSTVGGMLETSEDMDLAVMWKDIKNSDNVTVEMIERIRARLRKPFERFARILVEWNLEDPDTELPVPPTLEGILSVDLRLMASILKEWQTAVMGVSADLKDDSPSGETSQVLDLPMEAL